MSAGPGSTASGGDPLAGLSASGVFAALGSRYQPAERLGQGSFGVVFRALDLAMNREVALKLLYQPSERRRARFLREGQVVGKLAHPHVLPVHDVGEAAGVLYIAQRFVPGVRPLSELSPLAPTRAARIVRDVALAAQHAHDRGVVHRDIKPENVLVDAQDHAYLIDFGLASDEDQAQLTKTGTGLGTMAFSAPEQLGGARADARSDVYGLGATLYWALTGLPPIELDDDPMALFRVVPQPPSRRRPGLPADLDGLTLACLEKQPEERPASAAELAAALDGFVRGERPRVRRRRPRWAWSGLALAAACGLGWWALGRSPPGRDAPAPVRPPGPAHGRPAHPPAAGVDLDAVDAALVRAQEQEAARASYGQPLETLARAASLAGDDPRARELVDRARAGYLLRKGDLERGLREAERAGSAPAVLLQVRALVGLGRRLEAERRLERLVADPEPTGPLAGAWLRLLRGQPRPALELVREARRRLGPASRPAAHYPPPERELLGLLRGLEGQALLRLEQREPAVEALRAAIEALPLDPAPRGELARALLAAGRREEGLSGLDEAIACGEPRPDPALLRLRGVCRARAGGDDRSALSDLNRGLSSAPDEAEALFWRGIVKLRLRAGAGGVSGPQARLEGTPAEEDLTRARTLDPAGSSGWLSELPEPDRVTISAAMGLGTGR